MIEHKALMVIGTLMPWVKRFQRGSGEAPMKSSLGQPVISIGMTTLGEGRKGHTDGWMDGWIDIKVDVMGCPTGLAMRISKGSCPLGPMPKKGKVSLQVSIMSTGHAEFISIQDQD
jgi:hypothetical protein